MASQPASFNMGNVFTNIIGVISRNPAIFLGLSFLIVGLPQLLLGLAVASPDTALDALQIFQNPAAMIGGGASYIVVLVLSIVLQGALIVATANDLSGKPVDFGTCINRALAKFFPLLGLGILLSLGVGAGFLLLFVPGVILYLMWMVASPVLMVEQTGVIDSFGRSRALTKGSRWQLLGLLAIFFIFSMIVAIPFSLFAVVSPSIAMIGNALSSTVTSAFASAGVAAIYIELRNVKEGASTVDLADVFA